MTTTPTVLDITQNDNTAARTGDKLKRRVAFVTGGTRGIGAAICRSLASQGATLAAGYAGNDDAAKKFRDGFASTYGTEVSIHKGNVGEAADCRRTIDEVIVTHGRLDVLVNNAGINIRKQPQDYTLAEWRSVIDTNLTSAFLCSRAVYPLMKAAGGGKIINIGSMMSIFGTAFVAAYSASKGGIVQLTKSLAAAWARDNIQVNAVLPGWIDTELTQNARRQIPGLNDSVLRRTPAGRWGEMDDMAGIAVFLAASASDFVTGTAIPVDGGFAIQG
jgi:2-deoxy-D-gluconate 3-dehydrogenase